MIKGILLTIAVLIILHYSGVDVNHIIDTVASYLIAVWHWIVALF